MGITEKKNNTKVAIGIMIAAWIVLTVYMVMVSYFASHFYFGSEINGIDVSGKTVEEVKDEITSNLQLYTLNLKERGGKTEQIRGEDINLKHSSDKRYKELKNEQNPYKWIFVPLNKEDCKMVSGVLYDERLLKERIDKLSCFDSNNIIEPKNPGFRYTDKGYEITSEVKGNKVNKDILYAQVTKAVLKQQAEMDLESTNCYVHPEYTSTSPKVIEVRNILNKYISSRISYSFGQLKETIDGSLINKWLKVNENLEVVVDNEKMKNGLEEFFSAYNTVGKTRSFVTSTGKTINIGGGDYGWSIDIAKEIQDLSVVIKEGQTLTKEPTYIQTALAHGSNDIGNTYVEIDLTSQHLWFYKNGSLIVEGNVVTGNISSGHGTPRGIYRLKYKQRNAVLRGPGYSSPVSFWMPFNGGIGIHDASWRGQFGGSIYRTNGSHGCVNCPYYLAKEIFYNIGEGTPVICYY